jgi:lipoprotein signal peptidase
MNGIRRGVLTVLTLATLVGCDHVTKHVAKSELESQAPRKVIGSLLDLRYVENTDVAFNLLHWLPVKGRGPMLLGLGALGVLALAVVVARRRGGPVTRGR